MYECHINKRSILCGADDVNVWHCSNRNVWLFASLVISSWFGAGRIRHLHTKQREICTQPAAPRDRNGFNTTHVVSHYYRTTLQINCGLFIIILLFSGIEDIVLDLRLETAGLIPSHYAIKWDLGKSFTHIRQAVQFGTSISWEWEERKGVNRHTVQHPSPMWSLSFSCCLAEVRIRD